MTARLTAAALAALIAVFACLPARAASAPRPAVTAAAKATPRPRPGAKAGSAPATRQNGDAEPAADDLQERLAEETLKNEREELRRLQAELKKIQERSAAVKPTPAPTPTPEPKPDPKDTAAGPRVLCRSIAAAGVLYRLGRLEEALAAYTAAAAAKDVAAADRSWALVQAGNCCCRLKKFDKAIEIYQTVREEYPDHPWCREGGHVAWAAKAAQWAKRWQQLETGTGD